MRAAFTVIFLGWWLSRQRWMTRGLYSAYQKPSISVSPSRGVSPGENVTISCKAKGYRQPIFILHKNEGSRTQKLQEKMAEKNEVTFSINNVKKDNEGKYTCIYSFKGAMEEQKWSEHSEEVFIKIRDRVHPKPFISISPNKMVALGEQVTIQCQVRDERHADFYLVKKGASNSEQVKKTERNGTTFYFDSITYSDGGTYWCEYQLRQEDQFSHISDQVHINLTDPTLSRPSIKVKARQSHGDVTVGIDCNGPSKGLTFSLFKANGWVASQMSEPDRYGTQFSLPLVNLEDEENYTCRYQHRENAFVWSEPSKPVRLSGDDKPGENTIIIWASVSAGLLLLVLVLLLLAFILYRKRKAGSITGERNQPVSVPLQPKTPAEPDEVSYATLNHSVKIRQTSTPKEVPESCVYASVAQDRMRKE